MKKIYKVEVPLDGFGHEVKLGAQSRVLSVAEQGGRLVMWYEFTPQPDMNLDERWNIFAIFTGRDFIPYGEFVGTAVVDELVYHVYAGKL